MLRTETTGPWNTCPDCGGKMKTTASYRRGLKRVQRHACSSCRYVAVSVSMIVVERPRYGSGFVSLAKRLIRLVVRVDEE